MRRFSVLSFARIRAIFIKELIQMKRDRLTFAMMLGVPIMQLLLFGFVINTNPKHLPTAVEVQEQTPIVRTLLNALERSDYYDIITTSAHPEQGESLLASGKVAFVITIPVGFTEQFLRGESPQLLIEADASDPSASSSALLNANTIIQRALMRELTGPLAHLRPSANPVNVIVHAQYNPEGISQYNIVPGLLGVILTMTLVMITSMAVTRESEHGTMENLLAMPARPLEVMIGKISPYIGMGAVQTGIILACSALLFHVPFIGSMQLLAMGITVFILANLCVGYTFSTIAKSQMQAMQMTFFFFLPSMLLSGFMFPFRGMPIWAQYLGEVLPLTHFLRIIRGVMLKGANYVDLKQAFLALILFTIVVGVIAMLRYKTTLD
jgi:ABC-2 type transport system permease protein